MTKKICNASLLALITGTFMACSQEPDTFADPFPAGSGQVLNSATAYAPGPYGVSIGSTISNYGMLGFPDYNEDDSKARGMNLADFYNPDGKGVYPEDSPYGEGEPLPKALLVSVGASWCFPCQYEAADVFPEAYEDYSPDGGEFLMSLEQGPDFGPAEEDDLKDWIESFDLNYPGTYTATEVGVWSSIIQEGAFPTTIIIRTSDMEITHIEPGVANQATWAAFEDALYDE